MLSFDRAEHRYYYNGHPVVNVTRALGMLTDFSFIPAAALEKARQEGQAVHAMVEMDCKGNLDVTGLPEWMRGHYAAWRKFTSDTDFECWASEERVYHDGLVYAGTLDLAGVMRNGKDQAPAVIDIKRSFFAGRAIGFQTSAYLEAWNRKHHGLMRLKRRYALRLDANGSYRLEPFNDPNDFSVFLACLTLYRARLAIHQTHKEQA